MQLTPRYLSTNKAILIADLANNITEYKPVYQRNLQVYKGIDNVLTFEIKNPDQKPLSILNTYTPKFVAFDENNNLVVEHDGTILETSTPSRKGQFQVTVSENDLLDLKSQYMTYNIYLIKTADLSKVLTYANTHYGAQGNIFVNAETFPGPAPTYTIKTFTETDPSSDIFVSETVTAEPAKNGNEALHTAAFYTTGFEGKVFIDATLDNQITGGTVWGEVATLNLVSPTQPQYVNFNGVFSHLRARYQNVVSGTIDQVLIKN
jgi:hypothetical protein